MALTGKRKAFAEAVLIGKSNKEAAIAAGYSINSAGPAGSRLAKNPEVVAYLAARRVAPAVSAHADPAGGIAPPPAPSFDMTKIMHSDPKAFLLAAMNDIGLEPKLRIDAAKALMPFEHGKKGEVGKKGARADAAAAVGETGRFGAPPPPPRLVTGGKK